MTDTGRRVLFVVSSSIRNEPIRVKIFKSWDDKDGREYHPTMSSHMRLSDLLKGVPADITTTRKTAWVWFYIE